MRILADNRRQKHRDPFPLTSTVLDVLAAVLVAFQRRKYTPRRTSARLALQHADWHEAQAAKLRAEAWGIG